MINYKAVIKQINLIIEKLILVGLAAEYNYPSNFVGQGGKQNITYSCINNGTPNRRNLSVTLKDQDYRDVYYALIKDRGYHIKTIDGALITFLYTYREKNIESHVLSFLPAPDLDEYQHNPETYESDALYGDIIEKGVLPVPFRFDYDSDPEKYRELLHPKSHCTLGRVKGCRIPVCAPISPYTFTNFILRNFYNRIFIKYEDTSTSLEFPKVLFEETISEKERGSLHLAIYN